MLATILGCGTSTGVPALACSCPVCRSKNPRNHRTRASIWFQVDGKSILVDSGPDFRQQALREKIKRLDAVLYTHPHADHCHGIDDIRAYNFAQKQAIPIYGHEWTAKELPIKFAYIFNKGHVEGGGVPDLDLRLFDPSVEVMDIQGVKVTPLPLSHGSRVSVGYRIDSVAYVVDCSYIPPISMDRLNGLSVLVLDCVQLGPHRTHLNLDRALEMVERIKPKRTYLTHLGHQFDYAYWMKKPAKLPRGVALAYDGLKIKLTDPVLKKATSGQRK